MLGEVLRDLSDALGLSSPDCDGPGLNAAIIPERCSEAALHEWQRHVDDRDIQVLQKRAQHYRSAFSHLWVGIC